MEMLEMPIIKKPAPPQQPEQIRLYRGFLGLTQAQLAAELRTTPTSVSRWESGITPISMMTMAHVCALVTARVQEAIRQLFKELHPRLTISRYTALVGHPEARFTQDRDGNLYLGSVFIDGGYKKHVLYLRVDDCKWYGLDRDERATPVDEEFLRQVIAS
jgi:transcriptional regulator with XRE-family HTH domain